MSDNGATTVTVGMAVSICINADSYGATVVEVSASGHRVGVRKDRAKRGGLHVVDDKGEIEVFTRRADGRYRKVGMKSGCFLHLGKRETRMDPHF